MESKCWNFASLQCSIDFIANMELIFLQSLLKICVMRFCNCLIDLLYIYFFSLYSVSPLLSMTFICCCNPGLTIVLSVTHYGMPYWPPGAHKNPFPYLVTIVRSLFFVVVFFFTKVALCFCTRKICIIALLPIWTRHPVTLHCVPCGGHGPLSSLCMAFCLCLQTSLMLK